MGRPKTTEPASSKEGKSKKDTVSKAPKVKDTSKIAEPTHTKKSKPSATDATNFEDEVEDHISSSSKRKSKAAGISQKLSHPPLEDTSTTASKKRGRETTEGEKISEAPLTKKKKTKTETEKKMIKAKEILEDQDPVSSEKEEAQPEAGNQEEEVYLYGFSTEEDSSDDDEMVQDPLDASKLPNKAKDDPEVKKKLLDASKRKRPADEKGVLYIGRIPHGFYEQEMKGYFSQFGNVTRLRLSRNAKTGRPRHYGFIEFDSLSVAKIVSEAMDNYLLAGHLLQCKVIPNDKVHPSVWINANKRWKQMPRGRLARVSHNKERTNEQKERAEQRLLERQAKKQEKIKAAGIDYSLASVGYVN